MPAHRSTEFSTRRKYSGRRAPVSSRSTITPAFSALRTYRRAVFEYRCPPTVSKPPSRSRTWQSRGVALRPGASTCSHSGPVRALGRMKVRRTPRCRARSAQTAERSSGRTGSRDSTPPIPQSGGIEAWEESTPPRCLRRTMGSTSSRPSRVSYNREASSKSPVAHTASTHSGEWKAWACGSARNAARHSERRAGTDARYPSSVGDTDSTGCVVSNGSPPWGVERGAAGDIGRGAGSCGGRGGAEVPEHPQVAGVPHDLPVRAPGELLEGLLVGAGGVGRVVGVVAAHAPGGDHVRRLAGEVLRHPRDVGRVERDGCGGVDPAVVAQDLVQAGLEPGERPDVALVVHGGASGPDVDQRDDRRLRVLLHELLRRGDVL